MGEKHGVVRHLRFARQWLEQAEQEFRKDNPVRAELTLSLVLGEVRRAWEMSRKTRSVPREARPWPASADIRFKKRLFRAAAWGGGLAVVAMGVLGLLSHPAAAPALPTPAVTVAPVSVDSVSRELAPASAPQPEAIASERPSRAEVAPPAAVSAVPVAPAVKSPVAEGGSADGGAKGADRVAVADGASAPVLAEVAAPDAAAPEVTEPAAAAAEVDRSAPQIQLDLDQLVKLASDSLRGSTGRQ